jgi:putative transcriptional regulator
VIVTSRLELIRDVRDVLQRSGFATSDPKDLLHAGFDLVARNGQVILIIKVVLNADSINERGVMGMMTLARVLDGSPIIVALKAGGSVVEDGVVYTRASIPLLSPGTFSDLFLEGVPPMVYAAGGGYFTLVDSELLKQVRRGGVSLGELAELGGVSRRAIRMYEDGKSAKLDVAMRLEERLGVELILPVNPLSWNLEREVPDAGDIHSGKLAKEVFDKLHRIGYEVNQTARCPFDAVTHDERVILFTGVDMKKPDLHRRAKAICNLSRILEKHSVIFVDRLGMRVNLEGAPLIANDELSKINDKKRMLELVEERG